ncbi:hypothetical protein, partial [Neisseria sp. P0014.S009]|uniref:hypothetical protein n=1 Tax=Neisseria sp. P0014.S009 TaxID=3436755 RepID=UPI003F7D0982
MSLFVLLKKMYKVVVNYTEKQYAKAVLNPIAGVSDGLFILSRKIKNFRFGSASSLTKSTSRAIGIAP